MEHPKADREFEPGHISRRGYWPKWRSRNKILDDVRAQDILNHCPDVTDGYNFKPHAATKRMLSRRHRCSVTAIDRIWYRKTFVHLRKQDEADRLGWDDGLDRAGVPGEGAGVGGVEDSGGDTSGDRGASVPVSPDEVEGEGL